MKKELQIALQRSVKQTEDDYIFIEPVCKFFGINYRNQIRVLKKDPICQSDCTKKYNQFLFGDEKPRYCVGKRAFIRWIQIINVQIVHKDLQKTFEEYQVAVFDYLYSGNEKRMEQLEDIRRYATNINEAIQIKKQITDYIAEQKNHRDLCLATPPDIWIDVKQSLKQQYVIAEHATALKPQLPADVVQLKLMKKNIQTNIAKRQHLLDYQNKNVCPDPNPMPEGYRREMHKLAIRNFEKEINRIDARLIELNKLTLQTAE